MLATVRRVASYRSWTWTLPVNFVGDLWFFLYDDLETEPYRIFSIEMPELAATSVEYKALSIFVQDFSTEAAVPGAQIYLDGNLAGITDTDGLLHLTNIATGEHLFKAVKEGYLDTDVDGLSNDRIVVR